jgi:amidase
LARTVGDAALLLDVMANPAATDLHRRLRTGSFAEIAAPRALKVVWWTENGLVEPDREVLAAMEETVDMLRDAGHAVTELPNPAPWRDEYEPWLIADFGGRVAALVDNAISPDRREQLDPFTQWLAEQGRKLSAADYVVADYCLAGLAAQFASAIEPYDVALTPVTSDVPVRVGAFHRDGIELVGRRMIEWTAYTPLQNMNGLPAMSLPVHMTPDGLPVGVQITASRHGDEATLLSMAAGLEQTTGWHHRHPPQWTM